MNSFVPVMSSLALRAPSHGNLARSVLYFVQMCHKNVCGLSFLPCFILSSFQLRPSQTKEDLWCTPSHVFSADSSTVGIAALGILMSFIKGVGIWIWSGDQITISPSSEGQIWQVSLYQITLFACTVWDQTVQANAQPTKCLSKPSGRPDKQPVSPFWSQIHT